MNDRLQYARAAALRDDQMTPAASPERAAAEALWAFLILDRIEGEADA